MSRIIRLVRDFLLRPVRVPAWAFTIITGVWVVFFVQDFLQHPARAVVLALISSVVVGALLLGWRNRRPTMLLEEEKEAAANITPDSPELERAWHGLGAMHWPLIWVAGAYFSTTWTVINIVFPHFLP